VRYARENRASPPQYKRYSVVWMSLGVDAFARAAPGWTAGGSGALAGTTMAGRVAQPGIHDLEVDTSLLTPQDCAEAIRLHLSSGPEPSAFRILTQLPVG
jgi:chloramphenicol 3-O-phosphotransferase